MNIIFANSATEWGGGERWTERTAAELAARGHRVSLVVRTGSAMDRRVAVDDTILVRMPFGVDYHPATVLRLARLIRKIRPDVVVVHHTKDVRTAGVAARLAGVPVLHRNGFPVLHDNLRHRLTSLFIDRILTNSQQIAERYSTYGWLGRVPVDVVPNGTEIPAGPTIRNPEALGFESSSRVAVYAGRLTTVKRVGDLLRGFAMLPPTSSWRLAVLGTGSEEQSLRELTRSLLMPERVRFFGYRENATELIGAADLVVLPSEDEGMPNALMEAMARGVAVAATPTGDVPYLLEDGKAGYLVPVGAPEEWTGLFQRTGEKELRVRGARGRRRIEKLFTVETMVEGVERSLALAAAKR